MRPFPPLRSSRLRRKGRRSRAGPARAAPPSAISAVSPNAAPVSASSAAVTAAAAASAATMGAAAKRAPPQPPSRTPPQPPPPPRPSQPAPQREAKALAGPQQPQASPRSRREAPLPLEDKPAKKRWPWKAIIKWGVVTSSFWGSPPDCGCGLPSQVCLAPATLRAARRQNDEQGRADRSQRSAEPKGRSPSRPLITRPTCYLRT